MCVKKERERESFIIVFENISFEMNNSRNCKYLDIYINIYVVNRRFMIRKWKLWMTFAGGFFGLAKGWKHSRGVDREILRRDKNIGEMTMVFIGRNQHSARRSVGEGEVSLFKKEWNPSFVGMIYRQIFVSSAV